MGGNGDRRVNRSPKKWLPVFSTNRDDDETPYGDIMKENTAIDDIDRYAFSVFLWDSEGSTPYGKKEEIEEYMQGATVETLKAGVLGAGTRHNVWIYDHNSVYLLDDTGVQDNGVTTATGLRQRLIQPWFRTQSNPSTNIRLVHVRDLDPHTMIALGITASFHQVSLLRDAFWSHLTLDTLIRVKIPRNLGTFRMELHLPYFAFRMLPTKETLSQDQAKSSFRRKWTDLSFLNISQPKSAEPKGPYGLYESQMAFSICGVHEKQWRGYSFVDDDPNEEDLLEDFVSPGSLPLHACVDPISETILEGNFEITDPREYWLKVYEVRMAIVLKEYEPIVRIFQHSITNHQESNMSTLTKNSPGHQAEDLKKTFDWNQQTSMVLNHILDVLVQCLKASENFMSQNGDIDYFQEFDASPSRPYSSIEDSIQSINDSMETLEGLKDKLELLSNKCRSAAGDLQLRLTLEANEAVRNNGDFTHFTVSIISPVMVAMAYFSMPEEAAPFKLDATHFFVTLLITGLVIQLLFMAFAARPCWRKKGTAWMQKLYPYFGKLRALWIREHPAVPENITTAV